MEDKIIKIVAEILEVEESKLSLETRQEEIEEWDSLAHIRIISEIEEQLGKVIEIDKVVEIESIKELVQAMQDA